MLPRLRLLIVMLVSCGGGRAVTAESIPGWGEWINPDADCKYELTDGSLTVTVIGNPPHDYAKDRTLVNAPRVLRPAKDLTKGFIAEVTVSGKRDPGASGYHGAGLLYESDEDSIRLEAANFNGRVYINFEMRRGRTRPRNLGNDWLVQFDPTQPLQLRLIANDRMIAAGVKQGDSAWNYHAVRKQLGGVESRVGVLGINTSRNEFRPTFSGFKFTSDAALIAKLPSRVFANRN